MIRYDLKCARGCAFESWFRDSAAFDALKAAGGLVCAHCGSTEVEKALMAPRVSAARKAGEPAAPPDRPGPGALTSTPDPELARMLSKLREHLARNSQDVGADFPEEARRIHYGETEKRQIHGVASLDEARELTEEGVPVAPLPPFPRRDD